MQNWNEIKNKPHDASGIVRPEDWLWEKKNGVYYPAMIIENLRVSWKEDENDDEEDGSKLEDIPDENITGYEADGIDFPIGQ